MENQGKAIPVDYSTVFKNVPLAIFISDQQAVEICNPAAMHLFGHPAQTLVGMPLLMLWPAQGSRGWVAKKIFDEIADRGCYTDVRTLRHADAELFWCRIDVARYDGTKHAPRYIWTFVKIEPTVRVGDMLSPRERQIAKALVVGKTSRAIAQDVGLSTRTIEYYRERLMRRLGVANCKELICRLTIDTSASLPRNGNGLAAIEVSPEP